MRRAVAAAALLTLAAAPGCSRSYEVGIRYEPGRVLELVLPCGDEALAEVQVFDAAVGTGLDGSRSLWWLVPSGQRRATLASVRYGDQPAGYVTEGRATSLAALESGHRDRPLVVYASVAGHPRARADFRLADLPTDGSVVLGERPPMPLADAVAAQRAACEPFRFAGVGTMLWKWAVTLVLVAAVVGLVAAVVAAAVREWVRRDPSARALSGRRSTWPWGGGR